jgi:SAM-dependent methyltransferase
MIDRALLRKLRAPFRRARGRLAMSFGRVSSSKPLSRDFGYSRGTPIDRYYIERFLADHAIDISGRVLEIGDDSYSRRFGAERVEKQDILHVASGHPGATITGDLADPSVLPSSSFDCIILTQTLHLIFDLQAAIRQIHRALAPGGVALITVPGISPIDRGEWGQSWYWSLTDRALSRLMAGPFDPAKVAISTYGNLRAATAFLHGASLEEVGSSWLDPHDPAYPLTVTARAKA